MGRTFSTLSVGETLPTMTFEVSQEWVAKDSNFKQDSSPWATGPSPWGGPVAPPTLTNADFDRFLRANDFVMNGIIPTKTHHEYLAPLKVGTTISTSCTVVDRSERKERVYITFEFVTSDSDGTVLLRKRDTLMQLPPRQEPS